MGRQKIVVAVPIHRQPHPRMDASRRVTMASSRHKTAYMELRNESLISRARNSLLASFLETDGDWLYWWDDDIETTNTGGEAGNLLDMLVFHGKPFVGGLYATRGIGGHCSGRVLDNEPAMSRLWRIKYLAGGSMMLRRDAVLDMVAHYDELRYEPRTNEGGHSSAWALFQPVICEGEYLSEDYAFCQRWLDMGGSIYADLDVSLYHWGEAPFSLIDPRKAVAQ